MGDLRVREYDPAKKPEQGVVDVPRDVLEIIDQADLLRAFERLAQHWAKEHAYALRLEREVLQLNDGMQQLERDLARRSTDGVDHVDADAAPSG